MALVSQGARQASRETLAIATGYGVLDRDFRKQLGAKVPKFKALSFLRELDGKMEPIKAVKRHQYYFYEEGDWFNAACTISAASNSGSNVLVTLSSGDHYDSGTHSYPVVGQLCIFENETVGYVSSINRGTPNAHVVTVVPYNASQAVQTAAVVGQTVVFYGNIQPEKSFKTEMRVPNISKITNYIHNTRETYEVTDYAAQNEVEFEYDGQKFLYVKGIAETADRFAMQEENNLIFTPANDGTLVDASSNSLTGATGLLPQISTNGQTFEYDGDFTMADFDDLVLTIDDNYGDTEYLIGMGRNLALSMKNWLVDFSKFQNSGISFDYFETKEQALSFDFTTIAIGGVTFHMSTWAIMSHAGSFGAGNQPWRYQGVCIPCGNTKDPQSQSMVPYLQLNYSPPQGAPHTIQGDIKVWEDGANAKTMPTSDESTRRIYMESYKSLAVRNREKFIRITKP
jgi:hypothetical protein